MATQRSKYHLIGRFNFEDLYNAFLGLEQRQQVFWVMGAAVFVILLLVVPVTCASSKLGGLEREYGRVNKDQQEVLNKIAVYQSSKEELVELQKSFGANTGSLTTFIESAAKEAGIDQSISYLKPVRLQGTDYFDEEGVDGELKKVSLPQVVAFLYRLENHPEIPLRFKKLNLRAGYGRRDELTLAFTVSTLKMKTEAAGE